MAEDCSKRAARFACHSPASEVSFGISGTDDCNLPADSPHTTHPAEQRSQESNTLLQSLRRTSEHIASQHSSRNPCPRRECSKRFHSSEARYLNFTPIIIISQQQNPANHLLFFLSQKETKTTNILTRSNMFNLNQLTRNRAQQNPNIEPRIEPISLIAI